MKKEFENEEELNTAKKKNKKTSLIVLIIGLIIGSIFVGIGLKNQNSLTSEDHKASISQQLAIETATLQAKEAQLKAKGVKYNRFAEYQDGDEYDLKIIVNVLDPSFAYWKFDEYEDNPLTSRYCELKEELDDLENGGIFKSNTFIPFYVIGGFIIIFTLMLSISIYATNKKFSLTNLTNDSETIIQDIASSNKAQETEKLKECVYCGSLVKSNATECDSCGGKKFRKHKQ